MTMQDILDSKVCDFTGSMKDLGTRWDNIDQILVKSVRVTAIRNLDKVPTLAGLTKNSATELCAIQKKILDKLNETPGSKNIDFTKISSLSKAEKDKIEDMGLKITKDKYYSTVVRELTDEQRIIHMAGDNDNEKSFMVSMNFPYEQFIFVAKRSDGNFESAIK